MGGGPPSFPRGFTCPAVLRIRLGGRTDFGYRAVTFYGGSFQNHFTYPLAFLTPCETSYNPDGTRPIGLGCSRFARRYSGNRVCFLFLRVLRCFSSPGLPPSILWIQMAVPALQAGGLPHSEIPGSTPAYSSPRHIGVRPVLHRLLAPRHPPCALSSLTYQVYRHIL